MRTLLLFSLVVGTAFANPTTPRQAQDESDSKSVLPIFQGAATDDHRLVPTKLPQKSKSKLTKLQFEKKTKEKGYTKSFDVVTTVIQPTSPPTTIYSTTQQVEKISFAARTSLPADNDGLPYTTERETEASIAISTVGVSVHNANINLETETSDYIPKSTSQTTPFVDAGKPKTTNFGSKPSNTQEEVTTTTNVPTNDAIAKDAKQTQQSISTVIPQFGSRGISTATTTSNPTHTKSITPASEEDRILTLIDLERNNSKSITVHKAASVQESRSLPTPSTVLDVGHDGVKMIRKKQLLDKHFQGSGIAIKAITTGTSLKADPTGFLGPIFMKEKVFKVKKSDGLGIAILEDKRESFTTTPTTTTTRNGETSTPDLRPKSTESTQSPQVESKIADFRFEVIETTKETISAEQLNKERTLIGPTEFITQRPKISGKPEPAAIEIHINVSEGFGTVGEDLEFSYQQPKSELITLRPGSSLQNESSHEAEEILIVEIMDNNGTESKLSTETRSDEIFVPELKLEPLEKYSSIAKEAKDSDTIFYISNTEVKVGESVPTQNTKLKPGQTKFESQYFPTIYEEDVRIDYRGSNKTTNGDKSPERFEEDIILSPLKNNFDPLKIFESARGGFAKATPLDVSYVAESYIEVEESLGLTTTVMPPAPQTDGNNRTETIKNGKDTKNGLGIEIAVDTEVPNVPVIAAMPPQIELREIDFMPETNVGGESYANENPQKSNYEDERMVESSIQYGGDLIEDASSGGNFDIDSGFPFGNSMKKHFGDGVNEVRLVKELFLHHSPVSHLKKDQLIAEISSGLSTEVFEGEAYTLARKGNETYNGSSSERMGNATAYSVLEEAADSDLDFNDFQTLLLVCLATVIPLVVLLLFAVGVRYFWKKLRPEPDIEGGLVADSSSDPLASKSAPMAQDELNSSESGFAFKRSSDTLESSTEIPAKSKSNSNGDVVCVGVAGVRDNNVQGGHSRTEGVGVGGADGDGDCSGNLRADGVTSSNAFLAPAATTPHSPYNRSGSNGSIITMTLKNNHLIVETEERNDISRDARETKMHYNNAEKDGVFVVEVSRGADSAAMAGSPCTDKPISIISNGTCAASGHEEVQIHPPPIDDSDGILHQIDEADEPNESPRSNRDPINLGHSNTGLSQSDLSSSSDDSNKRYAYGTQELYTVDVDDYSPVKPQQMTKPQTATPPLTPKNDRKFENGDCPHSPSVSHKDDTEATDKPMNDNHCNGTEEAEVAADAENQLNANTANKPIITAALLKQDTVSEEAEIDDIVEVVPLNGELDKPALNGYAHNGSPEINDNDSCVENGFDSIISLPEPPSTEEIKQFNDGLIMESNQLDSLPPPPPPSDCPTDDVTDNNGESQFLPAIATEKLSLKMVDDILAPPPPPPTVMTALSVANESHSNGLVQVGSS